MGIRKVLIGLLGGHTKDEMKNNDDFYNSQIEHLTSSNNVLIIKNSQLDMWFFAFTDLLDNFNTKPLKENKFDKITTERIRTVSMFYRKFSPYSPDSYIAMEEKKFKELLDFVFNEFNEVFCCGFFSDESFKKFKQLEEKYKIED